MRIVILGAGAVGGYVGGLLADAGHDVTLVGMWAANVEAVKANGLELSGPEGSTLVRPRMIGVGEVSGLVASEPVDVALVSAKSYDTEWMVTLIKPYLASDGYVVSLQNCMNEETIARVVGSERTLGCVVASISVELFEPGRIRRERERRNEGHNVFRVGELDGQVTARAAALADVLQAVDNARVTTNLSGERWSKLANNAMNSGLGATTGLSAKQAMADPLLRSFMIDLGVETVAVADALGMRLERIGKIDPDLYVQAGRGDAAAREAIDRAFAAQADPRPADRVSSMGQDVRKGRRTEVDFLHGYVVESARRIGMATPANARVVEVVKQIERGRLAPAPGNLGAAG